MGSEFLEPRVAPAVAAAEPAPRLEFIDPGDGAPDSWEMADLEESMKKLLAPLCPPSPPPCRIDVDDRGGHEDFPIALPVSDGGVFEPVGSGEVDSFLRESLQGKDRLTILRLEQEVVKFMQNPKLQQLEFPPMPSSYLRLAAHRVVQHYNLLSSVVDCNVPEGTRIIARKTGQSVFPRVRLADIRTDIHSEEKLVQKPQQKIELKRRPSKGSKSNRDSNGYGGTSSKLNPSKSVEERKEEYNRARARIFNVNDMAGKVKDDDTSVVESSHNIEVFLNGPLSLDKRTEQPCDVTSSVDIDDGFSRIDSAARQKSKNRVAIFRDREKDRKDPDYDRSYDRYMQRFDPGFGVTQGPYGMQAVYTPVVNYNTEFPQLSGSSRPQICVEPPLHRAPQPVRGPWASTSNGLVYGHPDPMMGSYTAGHLGPHSGSGVFMQAHQFSRPGPSVTYGHPQDRFQQSISQPHLQPEGSFSQARRQ